MKFKFGCFVDRAMVEVKKKKIFELLFLLRVTTIFFQQGLQYLTLLFIKTNWNWKKSNHKNWTLHRSCGKPSKKELFVKIVNAWKPLTIFAKSPLFKVCKGSEYASGWYRDGVNGNLENKLSCLELTQFDLPSNSK